jgi:2-amino-4-hydroxy-6-hydroxymethyldihydropteridine diphosphokinase
MDKIYIAIGSNLNGPIKQLNRAIEHLKNHPEITIVNVSSFYVTKPVGIENQPDFINAVIEIKYDHGAHKLIDELLNIELLFGRIRAEKNGPRIIDLDILLFGDLEINDSDLTIPHPRMMERVFVLLPLAEIAPTIMVNETPIQIALKKLKIDGIQKVVN